SRAALIFISLFWIAMNVLLWRAEYGRHRSAVASVPPELIWRKMLTAPDSSSLSIFHHGKRVGFCHWSTSVAEDLSQLRDEGVPPEGMVRRITGYRVQFDGNFGVEELPARVRFEGSLKLTTNQLWQEFKGRLTMRPAVLELDSKAAEQMLHLSVQTGDNKIEHALKFSDLQDPEGLLRAFDLALAPPARTSLNWP